MSEGEVMPRDVLKDARRFIECHRHVVRSYFAAAVTLCLISNSADRLADGRSRRFDEMHRDKKTKRIVLTF